MLVCPCLLVRDVRHPIEDDLNFEFFILPYYHRKYRCIFGAIEFQMHSVFVPQMRHRCLYAVWCLPCRADTDIAVCYRLVPSNNASLQCDWEPLTPLQSLWSLYILAKLTKIFLLDSSYNDNLHDCRCVLFPDGVRSCIHSTNAEAQILADQSEFFALTLNISRRLTSLFWCLHVECVW